MGLGGHETDYVRNRMRGFDRCRLGVALFDVARPPGRTVYVEQVAGRPNPGRTHELASNTEAT